MVESVGWDSKNYIRGWEICSKRILEDKNFVLFVVNFLVSGSVLGMKYTGNKQAVSLKRDAPSTLPSRRCTD